jgi:hypothetical protein
VVVPESGVIVSQAGSAVVTDQDVAEGVATATEVEDPARGVPSFLSVTAEG